MVSAEEIGPPRCLLAATVGETTGHTTRNIAAARRTVTGLLQTGLGVLHAVIRLPNVKPVPGSKLPGRAGICPAIVPPQGASAVDHLVEEPSATAVAERASAIARVALGLGVEAA